jgi:hypothetical protein
MKLVMFLSKRVAMRRQSCRRQIIRSLILSLQYRVSENGKDRMLSLR